MAKQKKKKAFRFKLADGFLAGHNECPECIFLWIKDRGIEVEKLEPNLYESQHPTEYSKDGKDVISTFKSLYQEKHPKCKCKTVFPEADWKDNQTNCAFSSVFQVKCIRLGTPLGNLWRFDASRKAASGEVTTCTVLHTDKLEARRRAILGESQTVLGDFPEPYQPRVGVQVSKTTFLKPPMLIVGTNSFIRQSVPQALIQDYDVYTFFFPHSNGDFWQIGAMAVPRRCGLKTFLAYSTRENTKDALLESLYGIVRQFTDGNLGKKTDKPSLFERWLPTWIYRCPKISFKDVIHLEPFKKCG